MSRSASQLETLDDLLVRICLDLQLTPALFETAESRYQTVGTWLSKPGTSFAKYKPLIYAQGSFLIRTTVKPIGRNEFDLDFVCHIHQNWDTLRRPVDLLNALEKRLRENKKYEKMIERKRRCIRLSYADEFHLDILPACPDARKTPPAIRVPDREEDEWKPSNPLGYGKWLEGRAASIKKAYLAASVTPVPPLESPEEKPPLKRVVQLLKRWRDCQFQGREAEAPVSIVLTTLAGTYYGGQASVAEAFSGILSGIVGAVRASTSPIVVRNPSNTDEILSERWEKNPRAYEAFKSAICHLETKWQKLLSTTGYPAISRILDYLFGEAPVRSAVLGQTEYLQKRREAGSLGISVGSSGAGSIVTASASNTIPVRRNTFFGA